MKKTFFLLKLIFTTFLIYILLTKLEFKSLSFESFELKYLFPIVILSSLKVFIAAVLWKLIVATSSIASLLKYIFIGLFFNNFLPTMVGGDFARFYLLKRETGVSSPIAFAGIFLPRIWGLLLLVLTGIVGLLFHWRALDWRLLCILCISYPALLMLLFVVLHPKTFKVLEKSKPRSMILNKVRNFIKQYNAISEYFKGKRIMAILLLSAIIQITTYLNVYYFFRFSGEQIEFTYVLFFFPAVTLISMIPIALNGLGISEAGFTYFSGLAGIIYPKAIMISLVNRAAYVIMGLIGGVCFAISKVNYAEIKKHQGEEKFGLKTDPTRK